MDLKYIKADKCPICGCDTVVRESIEYDNKGIRTHCNGATWEHRVFLCGKEVVFIPNFMEEEFLNTCNNDQEYLQKLKKQEEDKEKILDFCKSSGIDKDIVDRIKTRVLERRT